MLISYLVVLFHAFFFRKGVKRRGVYIVNKTYSYLSLHIFVTTPTVTRREIRPKTDTHTPIIISGSWFDREIFCNGAAVVGVVVDGVDVSVIGAGGVVVVDGVVVSVIETGRAVMVDGFDVSVIGSGGGGSLNFETTYRQHSFSFIFNFGTPQILSELLR